MAHRIVNEAGTRACLTSTFAVTGQPGDDKRLVHPHAEDGELMPGHMNVTARDQDTSSLSFYAVLLFLVPFSLTLTKASSMSAKRANASPSIACTAERIRSRIKSSPVGAELRWS